GIPYEKKRNAPPEEHRIEGVADIRDESNSEGIRIVVEMKRDGDPNLALNKIRKHTELNLTFSVNATCLISHRTPEVFPLPHILEEFVAHRRQVIRRRTILFLNQARAELTRQVGLFAARSQVDEVVKQIRASRDRDEARTRLMAMEFACTGDLAELVQRSDPDL